MRISRLLKFLMIVSALSVFCASPSRAQDPPDIAQGANPQGTYNTTDFDAVDLVTGRLNIHIPLVVDSSQRGLLNFTYSVSGTGNGTFLGTCGGDPGEGAYDCYWSTPSSGALHK